MVAIVACCPAVGTSHLPLMPPGLLHEPVGGEMGCGSTRRVLMFDAEPDWRGRPVQGARACARISAWR